MRKRWFKAAKVSRHKINIGSGVTQESFSRTKESRLQVNRRSRKDCVQIGQQGTKYFEITKSVFRRVITQ
jgi:hypothetical protein